MYGIPENVDWSFLLNKELLQVCIGLHEVCLRFEGDVVIDIECAFQHFTDGSGSAAPSGLQQSASTLTSLLGARITCAVTRAGKSLELTFSNSEVLTIHDSNECHESFHIRSPQIQIVI